MEHQCVHKCLELKKHTLDQCTTGSKKGYGKVYLDIGNETQKDWSGNEMHAVLSEFFYILKPQIIDTLQLIEPMVGETSFIGVDECAISSFDLICDFIVFHATNCNSTTSCITAKPSMANLEKKLCHLRQ